MGRQINTFSKAIKHLKSSKYDMLEAAPTNNTMGLMSKDVHGFDQQTPDTRTYASPDFTQDDSADDTSGLFEADGSPKTALPPGDVSYILGPMSAMWYAWANYTQIGYIRESDRRMVNLGRISGRLGSWDQETGFTSYGQLTLEQAQWFYSIKKYDNADNDTPNYRAFYPGPPSNVADEHGRYLCVITGEPKQTGGDPPITYDEPPTPSALSPDEVFAALMDRAGNFDWDRFWQMVDAGLLAWDAISMAGVLFPELGSSLFGGLGLGLGRLFRGIRNVARGGSAANRARNRGGKGGGKGGPDIPRNPNGDVPGSTRKGKDWNVDNDTGIIRNDKGEVTHVPGKDADGNTTYKPIDQTPHNQHVNRGGQQGHPEYNPGGQYNTRPPVKNNNSGGGTSRTTTGGGTGGGGADTQYDPNIYTRGRTDRSDNWVDRGSSAEKSSQTIRDLVRDNITGVDRQRTSSDPNAGWNPLRGMPGYGTAKGKVNPRIRRINQQRKSQGKPELTPDQINPGGYQTGPDEASRRLIKGIGRVGGKIGKSNVSKNVTQRQSKKVNRRARRIRFDESIDYLMWEDAAVAQPASGTTNATNISSMNQNQKKEVEDYMVDRIETLIQDPNFVDNLNKMVEKEDEYSIVMPQTDHGGGELSSHAQLQADRENIDQEVESDIDKNARLKDEEKEEYKKLVALIHSENTLGTKDYHEYDSNQVVDIKKVNNWAIARSIITNRVTQHTYPQAWIDEYISGITYHNLIFPDINIKNFIPIVDDELGYVDDNIYVQNRTVMNNTSDTHQQTKHNSLAHETFFGGVGEGMSQIVIPKDGGVPYLKFKDYNYHNLRSQDASEIPGGGETDLGSRISFVITSLQSGAAHALGALSDLVSYGKTMKSLGPGWPEGIHGAAYTVFEVKLDQMSPYLQNMIKSHPLYWTDQRYEELFADEEAVDNEMNRIIEVMNDDNKTKGFVKNYTDELWKMDGDGKHIGTNPKVNDVMERWS